MSQVTSPSEQFTFILEEFASGDNEAIADILDEVANEGSPMAEY